MNRSASEWAFQQFLREEADRKGEDKKEEEEEAKEELKKKENGVMTSSNGGLENKDKNNIPADSEEYQAFLKTKLNLACAAVAMSRVILFFSFLVFFVCLDDEEVRAIK